LLQHPVMRLPPRPSSIQPLYRLIPGQEFLQVPPPVMCCNLLLQPSIPTPLTTPLTFSSHHLLFNFYSLTAPPIKPEMNCFWNNRNIIKTGMVDMDAPSIIMP